MLTGADLEFDFLEGGGGGGGGWIKNFRKI